MLNENEVTIRNQFFEMIAEGAHLNKPTKRDIRNFLNEKGYIASKINIWFDHFQFLHRWICVIEVNRSK